MFKNESVHLLIVLSSLYFWVEYNGSFQQMIILTHLLLISVILWASLVHCFKNMPQLCMWYTLSWPSELGLILTNLLYIQNESLEECLSVSPVVSKSCITVSICCQLYVWTMATDASAFLAHIFVTLCKINSCCNPLLLGCVSVTCFLPMLSEIGITCLYSDCLNWQIHKKARTFCYVRDT